MTRVNDPSHRSDAPKPRTRRAPILGPRAAAVVISLSALLGIWGGLGVQVSTDISALLPREEGAARLVEIARQAGMMRKVAVIVVSQGASESELLAKLKETGDLLTGRDGVERVITDVDPEGIRATAQLLLEHAGCLYRPRGEGMTADEVSSRLVDLKARLAAPEAMMMGEFLLRDPLGFSASALAALESSARGMGAKVRSGRLLSPEGDAGLVVAELGFDPMDDVERAAVFAATLDEDLSRAAGSKFEITALGGVHFTAANAGVIKSDIIKTFGLTVCAVVLIFLAFFRRLRLLPAALLPGGIGIAAAIAVMAAAKVELHGLTLGFAATLTGISVDYAIHLLHRALSKSAGDADTKESMAEALAAVWRPIALGCVTTTGAFVLVATSSFPGIRQLAVFSAVSVPVAMLATLTVLPAFHRFLLGENKRRPRIENSRSAPAAFDMGARGGKGLVLAGFALVFAAGLAGASRVAFEADPAKLGAQSPALEKKRQLVDAHFPGLSDQVLVAARGGNIFEALERNDALYQALRQAGFSDEQVVTVSPFLPSSAAQKASADRVASLLEGDGPGGQKLGALFAKAGFSAEYVASLPEKLGCDPLTPASFADTSFAPLVEEAVHQTGGKAVVLTRVRAKERLGDLVRVADALEGVEVVSERIDARRALETLGRELLWMLGVWSLSALAVLAFVRRDIVFGLRAVFPALFGVVVATGLFGWLGRPLTPVASAALTLVMGLGIDYGIFMQPRAARDQRGFAYATLVSALTTLAGFGVLAAAQVRAMADMGLIILAGVGAAVVCALFAVPLLGKAHGAKGERK